jgi:hypothetical protein
MDEDDDNNNSIHFLFICILVHQPKGQLQGEHEWKKETPTNYKAKQLITSE